MRTYTTIQGDMWDAIAFTQMGSCDHVDLLMKANSELLEHYIFPAGIIIDIPDVPVTSVSKLPPWKQVNR